MPGGGLGVGQGRCGLSVGQVWVRDVSLVLLATRDTTRSMSNCGMAVPGGGAVWVRCELGHMGGVYGSSYSHSFSTYTLAVPDDVVGWSPGSSTHGATGNCAACAFRLVR